MNTPNQPPRILVFDSGVGGLSILQTLREKLPQCHYIYASDNAGFPYGTKQPNELISRVDLVLKALTEHDHPDIIVVACNTASTVALPKIRAHFTDSVVGIVGVVPAIKPAAQLSKTKTIGLLATPGTVSRHYTKQLIEDFAGDCEVISVGSAELVQIAEQKLAGTAPSTAKLNNILAPFFKSGALDTIVLACTHFPLLAEELQQIAPRPVQWVDSGEAIARRVCSLLDLPQATFEQATFSQKDTISRTGFQTVLTAPPPSDHLLDSLKKLGSTSIDIISLGSP